MNPYNKKIFQIISLRAFHSPHIREIMSKWEEDQSNPIALTVATEEVINNLKFEHPGLQKWSNTEIIDHIKKNWVDRDQIQKDINNDIFERTKSSNLQHRESVNHGNIIKISDTSDNNELLDQLINEESKDLNWSKALAMTRYEEEAPRIILNNIEEIKDIEAYSAGIQLRDYPDLSVLTSYYDEELG